MQPPTRDELTTCGLSVQSYSPTTRPRNELVHVLLLISGHASTCLAYGSLPARLVAQGIRVLTFDPRGLGLSSCEASSHAQAHWHLRRTNHANTSKALIWQCRDGSHPAPEKSSFLNPTLPTGGLYDW